MLSIIILLRLLLTTLRLHCCSRCFVQHPSRNAEWIPESRVECRWFTCRHELVHGLRKEQGSHRPLGFHRLYDHHQLLSVHSAISLRHCSNFRQRGQKTLHRWSRRVRRRSVCKCDRILTTIMLHITYWISEPCCKFILYFVIFAEE